MPRPTQIDLARNAHGRPFEDPLPLCPLSGRAGAVLAPQNDPGLVLILPTRRTPPRRQLPAAAVEDLAVSALLEVAARRREA